MGSLHGHRWNYNFILATSLLAAFLSWVLTPDASRSHGGALIATVDCTLGQQGVTIVSLQSAQCFGPCLLTRNGEDGAGNSGWLFVTVLLCF